MTYMNILKTHGFAYAIVSTETGAIYRGWRYVEADSRKNASRLIRRKLREDYGKRIQILALR